MPSLRFLPLLSILAALLFFPQASAHAKFTLEFTDGRKITVSNYEEMGQTVKVYTSNGSFAFRKNDIARITNQEPLQAKRPAPAPAYTLAPTAAPEPQPTAERPTVSAPVTPLASTHDTPLFPGWDDMFGFVTEGMYRARFFIALFAGLKLLQFFLPASLR